MTTVFIDEKSRTGRRLLKHTELHPQVAQITDNRDNTPLPRPAQEYHTLEEFKTHMEKLAQERLGLKITL